MQKKINTDNLYLGQVWQCESKPNYDMPLLTNVVGRPIEYIIVKRSDDKYIDIIDNNLYKEVSDISNGLGINGTTILSLSSIISKDKISISEAEVIKDLYNSEIFSYTQRIKELYALLFDIALQLTEEQADELISKLNDYIGNDKTKEIAKLFLIVFEKGKEFKEKNNVQVRK